MALFPSGRITQDQYSKEMAATSVVECDEYADLAAIFHHTRENVVDVSLKRLPPKIKETEVKRTPGANDELMQILFQPEPPKTELTNTKQGVRVFVKKPPKPEPELEQTKPNKPETEERSSPEMKNPLYWFGYFPPPALTQAQNLYLQGNSHKFVCSAF